MALSIKEREKIKKNLPFGYIKKISSDTGYSRMAIYRYFKGISNNGKIETCLINSFSKIMHEENKKKRVLERYADK